MTSGYLETPGLAAAARRVIGGHDNTEAHRLKLSQRPEGRVTEYHAPFKAEGTDIRNAFGVVVGAGIDEVHATAFAAAPDMLAALHAVMRCARGELERPVTERQPWSEAERLINAAIAKAEGRANG